MTTWQDLARLAARIPTRRRLFLNSLSIGGFGQISRVITGMDSTELKTSKRYHYPIIWTIDKDAARGTIGDKERHAPEQAESIGGVVH